MLLAALLLCGKVSRIAVFTLEAIYFQETGDAGLVCCLRSKVVLVLKVLWCQRKVGGYQRRCALIVIFHRLGCVTDTVLCLWSGGIAGLYRVSVGCGDSRPRCACSLWYRSWPWPRDGRVHHTRFHSSQVDCPRDDFFFSSVHAVHVEKEVSYPCPKTPNPY